MCRLIIVICVALAAGANANCKLKCEIAVNSPGNAGADFVEKYFTEHAKADKAVRDAIAAARPMNAAANSAKAAADSATTRAEKQAKMETETQKHAEEAEEKHRTSGWLGSRFGRKTQLSMQRNLAAMIANGAANMADDANTAKIEANNAKMAKVANADTANKVVSKANKVAAVAVNRAKNSLRYALTMCTNACTDMEAAIELAITTIKKKHPNNAVGVAFGLAHWEAPESPAPRPKQKLDF